MWALLLALVFTLVCADQESPSDLKPSGKPRVTDVWVDDTLAADNIEKINEGGTLTSTEDPVELILSLKNIVLTVYTKFPDRLQKWNVSSNKKQEQELEFAFSGDGTDQKSPPELHL